MGIKFLSVLNYRTVQLMFSETISNINRFHRFSRLRDLNKLGVIFYVLRF